MRIKQRPEDFSVKESYRFDEVEGGRFRVYMMDKQKLSTFDAIARLRERYGLKPGAISYCGLKDKQGRTEQLIAVDGKDIDHQEPDLRLKFLGLTDHALSAANTTSNRFSVTVRAVRHEELDQLNLSVAEVNRLGVVNYYDSQRFGSLKHGQGYIAKDLIRGDFEAALKNYLARPSPLDRSEDAKVKAFWQANWNAWDARCPFPANKKYFRILNALRDNPTDYINAFLQIDSDYRALILFTFQSYLWNEGVRRLLAQVLPREVLFPMPYQAGTLIFHKDADVETLKWLRDLTFPLLAPDSTFKDPRIQEAAEWALGKEHIKLADLAIPESNRRLFFKHEERPLLVYPHKLVLGRTQPDEINKPLMKLNVAFTLPPGSYATLVIKRLFHFSYRDDTPEEIRATQDSVEAAVEERLERPGQLANRKREAPEEYRGMDRQPQGARGSSGQSSRGAPSSEDRGGNGRAGGASEYRGGSDRDARGSRGGGPSEYRGGSKGARSDEGADSRGGNGRGASSSEGRGGYSSARSDEGSDSRGAGVGSSKYQGGSDRNARDGSRGGGPSEYRGGNKGARSDDDSGSRGGNKGGRSEGGAPASSGGNARRPQNGSSDRSESRGRSDTGAEARGPKIKKPPYDQRGANSARGAAGNKGFNPAANLEREEGLEDDDDGPGEAPKVKKARWVDKEGNRLKRDRPGAPAVTREPGDRKPRPVKGEKPAPQVRKSAKPYKK